MLDLSLLIGIIIVLLCAILAPTFMIFTQCNFIPKYQDFVKEEYAGIQKYLPKLDKTEPDISEEFTFDGVYHFSCLTIAVWRNELHSQTIVEYLGPRYGFDIHTEFSNGVTVCTSSIPDSMFYPAPPKHFKECFKNERLPQLLIRHHQSLKFIQDNTKSSPKEPDQTETALRIYDFYVRELQWLKTIPFYYVKVIKWFYFDKFKLQKITIESQNNSHKINMINA